MEWAQLPCTVFRDWLSFVVEHLGMVKFQGTYFASSFSVEMIIGWVTFQCT